MEWARPRCSPGQGRTRLMTTTCYGHLQRGAMQLTCVRVCLCPQGSTACTRSCSRPADGAGFLQILATVVVPGLLVPTLGFTQLLVAEGIHPGGSEPHQRQAGHAVAAATTSPLPAPQAARRGYRQTPFGVTPSDAAARPCLGQGSSVAYLASCGRGKLVCLEWTAERVTVRHPPA